MSNKNELSTINKIEYNSCGLQQLGAELVYTQDRFGNYHSFYWQPVSVKLDFIFNPQSENKFFLIPILLDAYSKRIIRVLERRIPEHYCCQLRYDNQCFSFELVISPILPPQGDPQLVLVMGHHLGQGEICLISQSCLSTHCNPYQKLLTDIVRKIHLNRDPYQKLLTDIAHKIRRTLDLETIWQQTVTSLGDALEVSRCLLLAEASEENQLDVKAEYCQSSYPSLLGMRLNASEEIYLKQAMLSPVPITLEQIKPDQFQTKSILVVGTFYQKERNGIICLQQCDRHRQWSQAEIELVQELADQVGTAIAHATIYQKLEAANIQAEEASRLKSEFLASTSHELRTPLNGIIGFLKLILDGIADDEQEQQEFLEEAYNSAIHLLNLINDILDIAKIEAGKIDFEFRPIFLNEICDDVYKFVYHQAVKKNLNFKVKIPPTYDKILLYADYQRLLQVMLNLVGNAIKFTPKGQVEITAEIVPKKFNHNGTDFPGIVKINVADTGIGVSLDKQEKLFEKFYQVDGSRTKTYGGTGLGLVISKRLVEAMGGKISFYSMGEGLGSTVTLTIPLHQLPVLKSNHSGK
jgi:signal transduction histidine kinase